MLSVYLNIIMTDNIFPVTVVPLRRPCPTGPQSGGARTARVTHSGKCLSSSWVQLREECEA